MELRGAGIMAFCPPNETASWINTEAALQPCLAFGWETLSLGQTNPYWARPEYFRSANVSSSHCSRRLGDPHRYHAYAPNRSWFRCLLNGYVHLVLNGLCVKEIFRSGVTIATGNLSQQHNRCLCSLFVRVLDCSRFCSGQASKLQRSSPRFNKATASCTIEITWEGTNILDTHVRLG